MVNINREIISILDGHFEKTIEDCLKMASDNEAGHGGHNDNLFSNAGGHRGGNQPKKMYDASEDLFGDENEPQAENAFENLGMFKNNNANNQQAIDDDDDDFGDNGKTTHSPVYFSRI
jgi:hypothetical protein